MIFTGGAVELHGHRGARGLRPENTLAGFAHALELGVDAVELDVGITADGVVVLNHDQVLSPVTLTDTAPAHPGDPMFPYVGRAIRDLTLAQVKTLEAGVRRPLDDDDPFVLTQLPVPGTALPTLAETCALLSGAYDVVLAVELKTDPSWPDADVERFTAAVAEVLAEYGLTGRSRLLAFDWRVLTAAQRTPPPPGGSRWWSGARSCRAPRGWPGWRPTTPPAAPCGSVRRRCHPSTIWPRPCWWTRRRRWRFRWWCGR
ncbi:glycerophosphodiester phosphodiesterase family protein [Actinomadura keratinilytica]|uniref:glycerophosphodiester phosphodiesterase family protein n=1 Tax=Actinomadura keratinilytica TaxID=547461 RepID=UPI00360FBFF1